MEIPICLLNIDELGYCELNQNALAKLRLIQKQLCIVSISGAARTGKSFLLNRIMGSQKGFEIGPTTEPCTKGLWLWESQLELSAQKSLLLLDTQGLHTRDRSETTDMTILALSVLLSSVFIYNSMVAIGEQSIEDLSLVCHLADSISVKAHKSDSLEDYAEHFPVFVWALRDFALELVDQRGLPIDSRRYMEDCLKIVPGDDPETARKNEIRRAVVACFTTRACFTFPRPVIDERQLNQVERQEWGSLNSEFRDQVKRLLEFLFQKPVVKKMQGVPINGAMFASLVQNYVEAINQKAIPTIQTTWERVVFSKLQECFEEAYSRYLHGTTLKIKNKLPKDHQELLSLERALREESLKLALSLVRLPQHDRYLADFNSKCDSWVSELQERNSKQLQTKTLKETRACFELLGSKLMNSDDFSWFADEFSAVYSKITESHQGPEVFKNLAKEYSKEGSRLIVKLISQMQRNTKEKVGKLQNKLAEIEGEHKKDLEQLKEDNQELSRKRAQLDKLAGKSESMASHVDLERENADLREEIARLRRKGDEQHAKESGSYADIEGLFSSLIGEYKEARNQVESLEHDFEVEQKCTEMENTHKKEMLKQRREQELRLNEQRKESEAEIARINKENLRLQEKLRRFVSEQKRRDAEIEMGRERDNKKRILAEAKEEEGEFVRIVADIVNALVQKLEVGDTNGIRADVARLRSHAQKRSGVDQT